MARKFFSQALADAICERLAQGESLRAICRDADMPSAAAVHDWLNLHPSFAEQYARARNIGNDLLFEELLEICDTPSATLDNGATDGGDVAHRRLQIDTRKWYLAKLAPKKYGDKQSVELTGKDGGPVEIDNATAVDKLTKILASARARKEATSRDQPPADTSDLI